MQEDIFHNQYKTLTLRYTLFRTTQDLRGILPIHLVMHVVCFQLRKSCFAEDYVICSHITVLALLSWDKDGYII